MTNERLTSYVRSRLGKPCPGAAEIDAMNEEARSEARLREGLKELERERRKRDDLPLWWWVVATTGVALCLVPVIVAIVLGTDALIRWIL